MLDPDISTADAWRLLSQPGHLGDVAGPNGWTAPQVPAGDRRRCHRWRRARDSSGRIASVSVGSASTCQKRLPPRRSARTTGSSSTSCCTAATTDSTRSCRTRTASTTTIRGPANGNVAIPASAGAAARRDLRPAPEPRLHEALWDAGQLAIVHGVGYPNPDLSHFTSMAIWMDGQLRRRCRRAPAGSAAGSMGSRRPPPT